MEIEGIYLHGGVKGFSFINDGGTQTEADSFFKRFYDKITKDAISIQKIETVNKSFIVEPLTVNGRHFYDYTFMEYYIYDVNGRPSYVGITIRLSAFYCEIVNLFFILDTIFKKDIIGNLLLPKESTFMCVKEQIDKQLFVQVLNDFVELSSRILQDSDLRSVHSTSGTKGGRVSINLIDCQPQNVEKAIAQYGRLDISTDAPLQREFQSQQKLKELNQQWTTKWNELQGKYAAEVNKTQGLAGTIQSLQGQLAQSQNELQKVQREFKEYKSKNKLNYDIINGLKEEKKALLKLAGFVDTLGIEPNKKDDRDNKVDRNKKDEKVSTFNTKSCLLYSFFAIIVALIVWGFFSFRGCSKKDNISIDTATVSIDTTSANNDTKKVDIKNLTIDIAEFTNGVNRMTKNQVYTISLYDNAAHKFVEDIKGMWEIQDSDFHIENPESLKTTITPIKSGKDMEIQFKVEGQDTPIKRTIDVKE